MATVAEAVEALDAAQQQRAMKRAVQPSEDQARRFYNSWQWKRLRYTFLKGRARRCEVCGQTPANGAQLVVHHKRSVRLHWQLRLDPGNLTLVCASCNRGIPADDSTDWEQTNRAEQANGV